MDSQKVSKEKLEPRCKIWIEYKNRIVFGAGRLNILQEISKCGSIKNAAARLGMSYRTAWGKITATEKQLGIELLAKQAGGSHSGSELKPEAKRIIDAYINFENEANQAIEQLFHKHFDDIDI